MPSKLPLDHWPPPLPHPEGSAFAWEAMHAMTLRMMMETSNKAQSVFRRSRPSDLILEIVDTNFPAQPLSILHGLSRPGNTTKKPWWIRHTEVTIGMLKEITDADRIQIAELLCYDYAGDEWETRLREKELDEAEKEGSEEDADCTEEPWTVHYEWEKLPGAKNNEDDLTDTELIELYRSSDFREHMNKMTDLRTLYRALLTGTLENSNLYLFS